MPELLTRDRFREAVFARDGSMCVICRAPAKDAHHIIERRLWPDGGYYLDNGASVCEPHHIACETTEISVEEVRAACGIRRVLVPPHLYVDQPYDKWGNPVLPNGQRLKGELFFDASVQKILAQAGVLGQFTHLVKYPRTHHLPWSEGITEDDRIMPALTGLVGRRVIATEKMDGENTTLYRDHFHARSVASRPHESQTWVKQMWGQIAHEIPDGWRVCGENLYAGHSIPYTRLPSYFLGFSIWTDRNECLAWDDTLEWFDLLRIVPVPLLYDGVFDEAAIKALWKPTDWHTREGYVVRTADGFTYGEFRTKVGKFVRPHHVQTVQLWKHGQRIDRNRLASDK
jgi:hypothetical protein